DAMHRVHCDRSGLTTYNLVHCGEKWWIVGLPANDEDSCASIEVYGKELWTDHNVKRGYKWYGLLLVEGDLLILPPGTLHIVFTPTKSICTGGYTFNASTMAKTVYSIYHNFVGSSWLTNTLVGNEFSALLRIVLFWESRLVNPEHGYFEMLEDDASSLPHIPNLMRMDDPINLLSLLNFADLAWDLTPERYWGRKRKFPGYYQAAKVAANAIRKWLYSNFVLLECNESEDAMEQDDNKLPLMSEAYLLHHAHLLV
ncbi:hypothetical protein BDP27DRAFT_1247166, partial [Rhodocollybia butyracea]